MTTFARNYAPTAAERAELQDIQDYLAGHAKAGTLDRLPEGSVAAVMNKASPAVRQHMLGSKAVVENFRNSGGREMPFEPKRDISDLNVPSHVRQVMDRADTEDVTHGLLSRMGSDNSRIVDAGPPDLRETLSASFDAHQQE